MKTQHLGDTKVKISRLAYGNMRSVGTWNPAEVTPEKMETAIESHIAAYEAGYTHFDSADIYCAGQCEIALGKTLKRVKGMKKAITIATKCGIRFGGDPNPDSPHRYDFSAEHILWSCDNSLTNLDIERIDLYYLHRPDLLMNPPEIAKAFNKLKKAGKVKHFGVSNFLPSFVNTLQAFLDEPLVANQVEIHPARLDPYYDGTLDQCIEKNITPLAWSPLAGGWLGSGRELKADHPEFEKRKKLLDTIDTVAGEWGISRTVTVLAWLMKHPSKIVPIIGSNNPANIKEAAKADDIELTREQWYRILVAARGKALP
jgi:predicted oxidoreductase